MCVRRKPGLWLGLLVFCALPPSASHAGDVPAPLARAHLHRVAKDGATAAWQHIDKADLDPWIVVEELLLLDEVEAAKRLAQAPLRGADPALRLYIERAPERDAELAGRVRRAQEALAGGEYEKGLSALGAEMPRGLTVGAARAIRVRIDLLEGAKRGADARRARNRLTDVLDALGWRRAAIEAYASQLAERPHDDVGPATRRILTRLVGLDQDSRHPDRSVAWCARLGALEAAHQRHGLARAWLLEADGLMQALEERSPLSPSLKAIRADTLTCLALSQIGLGEVGRGLGTALRADTAARELPSEKRVQAARALTQAHRRVGRWEEAEVHARAALAHAHDESALMQMRLRGDLAFILLKQAKVEDAQDQYAIVRKSPAVRADKTTWFTLRLHEASTWLDSPWTDATAREWQESLIDLADLRRELESLPDSFPRKLALEANTLALQGRGLNLLDRSPEAIPILRQVLDLAEREPSLRPLQRYVRLELARALRRTDAHREALALTTKSLDGLRGAVDGMLATHAMSHLTNDGVSDLVREHLAILFELGDERAIREGLEKTRGLAFESDIRRRKREHAGSRLGSSTGTIEAMARDVAVAARAYWQLNARSAPLGDRKSALDALWAKRKRLRQLEERANAAEALATREKTAPSRIAFRTAPALRPDEAVVYLAEIGSMLSLVVVHGDRLTRIDLGPRGTTEDRAFDLLTDWLDATDKACDTACVALLDAVVPKPLVAALQPEAKRSKAIAHVYVSTVGSLASMPWPALLRERLRTSGWAQASIPTISLIASQDVLRHVRNWHRGDASGPILAVGDPDYSTAAPGQERVRIRGRDWDRLKETRREVETITDLERGDMRLLGTDANERLLHECLFEAPYPFDVLHIACHGKLYDETPWLSGLALHATDDHDGLLTVEEVSRWSFPGGPRLVVLAACESGLGAPIPGEGEEGLVRAFLLAGARHVVASLWKVPDRSSSDLMIAFHRHRREGLAPAAALAAAQDDVRAAGTGRDRPPRAWAGWATWGPRQ